MWKEEMLQGGGWALWNVTLLCNLVAAWAHSLSPAGFDITDTFSNNQPKHQACSVSHSTINYFGVEILGMDFLCCYDNILKKNKLGYP